MGIMFTKLFSSLFGNKEARILVLGLDNAGKTTILYRLQMGEVVSTIPSSFLSLLFNLSRAGAALIDLRIDSYALFDAAIGFNVETVQHNNIKFQVWDLGMETRLKDCAKLMFILSVLVLKVGYSGQTSISVDTRPVSVSYLELSFNSLSESEDQIIEVFRKGEGDVKGKILETEGSNDIIAIKESREQNQFYSKKAFHCQIFSATGFSGFFDCCRPYWRCYFPNTQAIVYVVDSSDTDRLVIAKDEFHAILEEEELKGAVVLVFANKQDLPGAVDDAAVTEALELHKIKNRQWAIFKASAIKGEGLFEGLDW
ncbi:hypothetical protein RHSIM_Rhsim01G0008800 [Rhododendron simsii]|uniref:ADP-ribosylation factor 1 n=1 Tax=Rhododendron simsii TaxID=118357 RepID=A0A834HL06_RHOSS|nr:hypothetical protein RHSIM_Rhsim01G0008800 [Rhododendron simsii]